VELGVDLSFLMAMKRRQRSLILIFIDVHEDERQRSFILNHLQLISMTMRGRGA
jgi:hypothetical protein